ncbi:MAG TPA: hypothetical protein PLC89_19485 [Haliscomenobacter sp.]|uniref:hypothetical protein n=1 Tax=Haliscomenobacter sp. TaxID=2717303 RepID=UPI002C828A01|nr:hypothetical protein [Haliscomenobacter sp.]HOY19502.1 hypothetical protein [Haliscomenobacter sp.]HPH18105.1 hypothetical protein [Haliscomenobacter sp.]
MKTYLLLGAIFGAQFVLVAQKPARIEVEPNKKLEINTLNKEKPKLDTLVIKSTEGNSIGATTLRTRAWSPAPALAYPLLRYEENTNRVLTALEKEIEIVCGVLQKIIEQEFNVGDTAINVDKIKGSYIVGSGVLFTISQHVPFYRSPRLLGVNGRIIGFGTNSTTIYSPEELARRGFGSNGQNRYEAKALNRNESQNLNDLLTQQPSIYGVITPNAMSTTGDSVEIKSGQNGRYNISTKGSVMQHTNAYGQLAKTQDSVFASKIPRMKKVLEKFLAEYTILLSKLKPEEKIWVTWSIKEDYWGVDQGKMACELSSRIAKQDMLDLRAGKLDQAKFAEKIHYSVTRCAERVTNPEVEVFTAILERLYSPHVSQSLVQFGAVQAEVVGGFGYVFKMNFSPAWVDSLIEYHPNTYASQLKVKGVSKEELDQRIKAFKVEFPQQLLEYSRVLKGLKAGEILKVDVSIGEYAQLWRSAPEGYKQFSLTIPQTLIRDYDTGKLKLEDAVKLIQVEEK